MNKLYPIIMIILIAAIITMSAGWPVFFNLPSLIMVIFLPLTATLTCARFGELLQSIKIAFKPEGWDPPARKKALVIQKALARNLDYTGALGFLIGITAMFANLSDPMLLGKGLALALLIIVYAVILKFVFIIPMVNALAKSLAGEAA